MIKSTTLCALICLFVCSFESLVLPGFYFPNINAPGNRQNLFVERLESKYLFDKKIIIDSTVCFYVSYLSIGCAIFLCAYFMNLISNVTYIKFNTNLTIRQKSTCRMSLGLPASSFISIYCLTFIFIDCPLPIIFAYIANHNLSFLLIIIDIRNYNRLAILTLSKTLPLYIFSIAFSPYEFILCNILFQLWCLLSQSKIPSWLLLLLITLSNDVHINPGPCIDKNYLSFMSWNLNSLVKNSFERISLIEAHNSIYHYDIISVCETNLNDSLESNVPELEGYNFIASNHPANVTHGGVGLFYKNSLPVIPRYDLSFAESIVIEMKFGRKKVFFTILYRSPSSKYNSPEFESFLINLESLYSKIKSEKPYACFFTGDFNAHSQLWWPKGDTNNEGIAMDDLFSSLNLVQLISEPTNFQPGKNPSCIDLITTDQPNLILASGTRDSLDPLCHHKIIFCNVNLKIPAPLPFQRRIWH